jgi:HlyD family secretion protein
VNVKLNVLKPPLFLTQDMTVSVEIEVARSQNALSLNVEAIRDASTLHPWVMAVVDGRAVRRPVTIGIRGDKSVEITSGLNQHDVVLPATNMTIEAGQRVRPVVTKNPQS